MRKFIFLLLACNVTFWSCDEDDSTAAIDYGALDAIIAEAQAEADPSKEGDRGGDVVFGATQILQDAIDRYSAYKTTAVNQGTVDSAINLLTLALETYRNSIVVIDNASLLQSILAAQGILDNAGPEGTEIGDYIIGSKAIFQMAIDAAQVVADNASATQSEINGAETDLNVATTVFEASVIADTDFTALNDAITSAQELVDNAVEGTENGQYAVGSKAILQGAIDAAEVVADNLAAQQLDVDQALMDLNTAVAAFEAGKIVPPSFLTFEGDDYIKVDGFKAVTGGGARTCEAWVRTTSSENNIIIMSWGENSSAQKWDVRLHNANRALRVEYNGGGVVGTKPLNDGEWHHIAIVVPAEGVPLSSVLLYVDGQPEPTTAASGGNPINTSAVNDFEIGRSAAQPSRYWIGGLTDIRVWDDARTAAEIAANYDKRLNGDEAGLMGYWKLDEGTGNTVQDSSTNGNSGTLGGDLGETARPLWTEIDAGFPFDP
ncbi:LamG domain-containing protein [Muricauda sp. SCSIO 64092]|uniref:LamG domain-containing protein n=1 Tax=Allomuricauda sp. SCSIO 64092 TaxID=2908842 RepID=UPI001FF4F1FC|nr:LamG domain-containing protein [Muricauda sp. SCSIO 64092]UOY08040.1 LamG domain-containing protein [Muricauda sp. SCSIO 64092]